MPSYNALYLQFTNIATHKNGLEIQGLERQSLRLAAEIPEQPQCPQIHAHDPGNQAHDPQHPEACIQPVTTGTHGTRCLRGKGSWVSGDWHNTIGDTEAGPWVGKGVDSDRRGICLKLKVKGAQRSRKCFCGGDVRRLKKRAL